MSPSNSKLDIKFVLHNLPNFQNCYDHIEKHLALYKINNYEFRKYKRDQLALYIRDSHSDIIYILYLDTKALALKLINEDEHEDVIDTFNSVDCWAKGIKKVSELLEKGSDES